MGFTTGGGRDDLSGMSSLAGLRARIDAIDREVLLLLERRNEIVADIARHKRAHGVPIRDRRREDELIRDRRARAADLGLAPEAIESMYRLILWASRDRQAALRAEVPPDLPPRTVAVVGGHGGMGRLMAAVFADLGHAVLVADVDTDLTPEAAAAEADVVVVSVPIDRTVEVVRRIGPCVRDDALLTDVTSIKTAPMQAMLAHCRGSVVGLHPLFGPSVHTMQGQRVVVVPGRGDSWQAWLETMLRARGLTLHRCTADEHDRAMAVVQVLTHFATEVVGRTLVELDVPLPETLPFTSPVYLMELLMTGRHFAQSPALYADIQMSNPRRGEVTAAFVTAAQELASIVDRGDRAALTALFDRVRAHFGDFTREALERSSHLIDRVVERD